MFSVRLPTEMVDSQNDFLPESAQINTAVEHEELAENNKPEQIIIKLPEEIVVKTEIPDQEKGKESEDENENETTIGIEIRTNRSSADIVTGSERLSACGISEKALQFVTERAKAAEASKARGSYNRFTPAQRAEIGNYARLHGPAATVRAFRSQFPSLNESTVRNFRRKILRAEQELASSKEGFDPDSDKITAIKSKPRGRPLKLKDLDEKVMAYLRAVRERGTVMNYSTTIAVAKSVVEMEDKTRLAEHGGDLTLDKPWAVSIFRRMDWVKKKSGSDESRPVSSSSIAPNTAQREVHANARVSNDLPLGLEDSNGSENILQESKTVT